MFYSRKKNLQFGSERFWTVVLKGKKYFHGKLSFSLQKFLFAGNE